jgi:hypothetical protein
MILSHEIYVFSHDKLNKYIIILELVFYANSTGSNFNTVLCQTYVDFSK